MAEFTVADIPYKSKKMSARTQIHVMRRLAPMVGAVQGFLGDDESLRAGLSRLSDSAAALAAIEPVAEAFAALSDADTDYVIDACLRCVERRQVVGGTESWAGLWVGSGKPLMFGDVTAVQMLQIVGYVVWEDLFAPMFGQLPVARGAGAAASAPTAASQGATPPRLGDRDTEGRIYSNGGGLHPPRWIYERAAA